MSSPIAPLSADLFCRVIDNLGDIGVMWRLSRQLSHEKNWRIRLWVDRLESLAAIEPRINARLPRQTCADIDVCHWPEPWPGVQPHRVVIAGFSCDLPDKYLESLAATDHRVWIQLEYLSAESWTASFHGLGSIRNDRLKPVFFFPGFTKATGGLLREQDLIERRQRWAKQRLGHRWLADLGVKHPPDAHLVSVFTYPHAPLHTLIEQLQQTERRFHLIIPSSQALPLQPLHERVTWQSVPFLSQTDYDKLLWSCALNLVRGEDSFVRAIWAGQPLIWQIYPQKDGAHHAKLQAWLDLSKPPPVVTNAMHEWADGTLETNLGSGLTGDVWAQWCASSQSFTRTLTQQTDLATRLDAWVRQQTGMLDGL